jgi:hypothetical protein
MIHLVTHYHPKNIYAQEMFDVSREFNRKVAERHGWNFIADSQRRVPHLGLYREKAAILVDAMKNMQDGDLVLRIDGDCLIIGQKTPEIFNELGQSDLALPKMNGRWTCSVVAFRVNAVTREMWDLHTTHEHVPDSKPGWDGHVCKSCPWPEWKRGLLCGSRKTSLAPLHRKWSDIITIHPDTEIVGYHGYDVLFKRAKILEVAKQHA